MTRISATLRLQDLVVMATFLPVGIANTLLENPTIYFHTLNLLALTINTLYNWHIFWHTKSSNK